MTTSFLVVCQGPGNIEVVRLTPDGATYKKDEAVLVKPGEACLGKYVYPGQEFLVREVTP